MDYNYTENYELDYSSEEEQTETRLVTTQGDNSVTTPASTASDLFTADIGNTQPDGSTPFDLLPAEVMQFIFIYFDEQTFQRFACICHFERGAVNSPWRHAFLEWETYFSSALKNYIRDIVGSFNIRKLDSIVEWPTQARLRLSKFSFQTVHKYFEFFSRNSSGDTNFF